MDYSNNVKKIKRTITIVVLFIIAIIVYVIIMYISRIGKVPITVKYAPFNSIVTIDGEGFKNNSKHYIAPGEHSIEVSLENFDTLKQTVTISEDSEYLFGYLYPNNDLGEKIREEHSKDYQEIEGISSYVANLAGQKEQSQRPILKYLPFKNSLFSIGYTYDESNNFIVTIRSSVTYLSSAIEKIKEFDSVDNLSKYNIQIIDFDNKLDSFIKNSQSDPRKYLMEGFSGIDSSVLEGTYSDEYYYTDIIVGSQEKYNLITYKVILKKDGDSWKLINTPYPFLTTYNTDKGTPIEIIIEANNF